MKVSKSTGGSWLDKKTLQTGDIAKLVSEADYVEGQNGQQLVAQCRIKGDDGEAKNVAINSPTKNAFIEAFGDDTALWMNKHLTVHVEKTMIAGKRGVAMYLVPEGYEVTEDAGGYLVIARQGAAVGAAPAPKDSINPEDIPF